MCIEKVFLVNIYRAGGKLEKLTNPEKINWGKMDFSCDYDDIIYFLPFDLKFTYILRSHQPDELTH